MPETHTDHSFKKASDLPAFLCESIGRLLVQQSTQAILILDCDARRVLFYNAHARNLLAASSRDETVIDDLCSVIQDASLFDAHTSTKATRTLAGKKVTLKNEPIGNYSLVTISRITLPSESPEFHEAAFQSAQDVIMVLDPVTCSFLDINQAAQRVLGYSPSQLIGKSPLDISPPVQPGGRLSEVAAPEMISLARRNGNHIFEWIHLKDDGVEIPVEIRLSKSFWHDQEVLIAAIIDISARKRQEAERRKKASRLEQLAEQKTNALQQANTELQKQISERLAVEEELRELAETYLDFFDNAPVGYHSLDADGIFVDVNQTECKWLELTREQIIGKRFLDFVDPNDHWVFRENFPRFKATGFVHDLEFTLISSTGKRMNTVVNAAAVYDENGQFVMSRSSMSDVTALKKVRQESAEALARLETLMNRISDAFISYDSEFRYLYLNPGAEKLLRYSRDELIGKSVWEVYPESVGTPFHESAMRVMQSRQAETLEYYYQPDDKWYVHRMYPSDDGVSTYITDITDYKAAEIRINQLNQSLRIHSAELEVTNKELESFSYSVSHDLRAPLRSLDGFSLALLEDYSDRLDDTAKLYLDRIRLASQKMGRLIDDLLKLSKVARSDLVFEEVNLSDIAHDLADSLREASPERSVRFEIQPGLVVKADERMMRLVLENLLGNAFKYSAEKELAVIEVFTESHDLYGDRISIRDNGAGFDMRYAGKLFGAFQRLHSDNQFMGEGIGLAIVQRVIHRHGGKVWAHGEVNNGATFSFQI